MKMDAISKAFHIFEIFLNNPEELTVSDVSKLAKISSSTTHRIISILVRKGYVDQKGKRGKYSISSPKLVDLLGIIRKRLNVRSVALPYLNELSQTVDETALIALRTGHIAFNLETVNINHILNLRPDANTFNLYSTGVGKIFLAYMSEKELNDYFNKIELKPRTAHTITNIDELKRDLERIKKNRVAFDDEEQEVGMRMIAAPIMDCEGNVAAAIGLLGYTHTITKPRMNELGLILKKYALQISQAMGYKTK
jgi:DNA-binding IclR family transcriptional regulator